MRPQHPELARLLATAVVPVRLTSIKGVDLSLFEFDTEQTLMALLMDVHGNVHFRWSASDTDPTALDGLRDLLKQSWPVGKPRAASIRSRTLADNPRFRRSKRFDEACWHCHYAADAEVADARAKPGFDKFSLFRYPPATTLGIELQGSASTRIRSVAPGSTAATAGLQTGDQVLMVNGRTVRTDADFRFALDRIAREQRRIVVALRRGENVVNKTLELNTGWRSYDISDRPSQGMVPPILGIWEERLGAAERRSLHVAEGKLALRVTFLFPGAKWEASRGELRVGDIVLGVVGEDLPDFNARQFHTWIRMNRNVGDTLRVEVLRGGKRMRLDIPCTDPGFEG